MTRDEVLAIYSALVAPYDDLKIKGAKSDYTSMNGNMFSFLDAEGVLCFRLSEAGKVAFNLAHGTSDVVQYGAVMRGYVAVPETMFGDNAALQALFGEVVDHARMLKPKPTKKSKPKA